VQGKATHRNLERKTDEQKSTHDKSEKKREKIRGATFGLCSAVRQRMKLRLGRQRIHHIEKRRQDSQCWLWWKRREEAEEKRRG
jgi:hypothetical protein